MDCAGSILFGAYHRTFTEVTDYCVVGILLLLIYCIPMLLYYLCQKTFIELMEYDSVYSTKYP